MVNAFVSKKIYVLVMRNVIVMNVPTKKSLFAVVAGTVVVE